MVERPEDYKWSSYASLLQSNRNTSLVYKTCVLERFGFTYEEQKKGLQAFLLERSQTFEKKLEKTRLLGDKNFLKQARKLQSRLYKKTVSQARYRSTLYQQTVRVKHQLKKTKTITTLSFSVARRKPISSQNCVLACTRSFSQRRLQSQSGPGIFPNYNNRKCVTANTCSKEYRSG